MVVPSVFRNRVSTSAGNADGFAIARRVSKNTLVAPSARKVITKPRGCVSSANSCALVLPSPSGSPLAPLARSVLSGLSPYFCSHPFVNPSPSASPAGSVSVGATLLIPPELLPGVGSNVCAPMVAVLVHWVPGSTLLFTVVTSVMVADVAPASVAKVTVRLAPLPPHAPPPVDAHDTNVTCGGRGSDTTTLAAGSALLFVTVIVYVSVWPGSTVTGSAGLATLVRERSAENPYFCSVPSLPPPP